MPKNPKPSAWTDPPAAALRIVLTRDEQGLTPHDKAAQWEGLTAEQANKLQNGISNFMRDNLPPDVEWSVAAVIFTSRPGDAREAVDCLASSTKIWDPEQALQDWLDDGGDE